MMFKFLTLAAASFCTAVLAQAPPTITYIPSNVTAGTTYNLTWFDGDGTPVSLTLMAGPSTNLLQVGIIAQDIAGTSYTWVPDKTLVNGDNYAMMIAQGTQFSISPQFAIAGGAAPNTTTTTTSSTSATSTSSATDTPTSTPLNGNAGNSTTHATKQPLEKGGIVGLIIGCVAIFAALATLVVFFVASKALAKKAAAKSAAGGPETAGLAANAQRPSTAGSRGPSPSPAPNYFKRKGAMGSEEQLLAPAGNTASPMAYRSSFDSPATVSPGTHFPPPGRRFGDGESSHSMRVPSPSLASGKTSPDAQWDGRDGSAATLHRPVSSMHPGTLVPQYTGETMVSSPYGMQQNFPGAGSSRGTVVSALIIPEAAELQPQYMGESHPQHMGESHGPGESSRGGRERRISQPPNPSKLRQEVD